MSIKKKKHHDGLTMINVEVGLRNIHLHIYVRSRQSLRRFIRQLINNSLLRPIITISFELCPFVFNMIASTMGFDSFVERDLISA